MKFTVYAAGPKGHAPILETDSFADAITAAYEGCGWVLEANGNAISIVDDEGRPIFPELVPESMK